MNEKQRKLYAEFVEINAAATSPDCKGLNYKDLMALFNTAFNLLADGPMKELKDYTLAELAELVHDMAKEKGWWDAPREWSEIACLIHSEISEAVECYRNGNMALHIVDGKPEGLVVELADVLIRCLDYAVYLGQPVCDDTVGETVRKPLALMDKSDMLGMLFNCHGTVAMEVIHNPVMENIIWDVASVAHHYNLDLQSAVVAKIEYNAKRPYRHGGKKA